VSKMSLHFTAERSLGTGWSQASDQVWKRAPAIQSCEAKRMGRGRVLPQMTVTGCGSPALNATCFAFAAPAWLPCEISFGWNQGFAGSCMYWSMRAHAPFCAACTVTAP